jgi:hypothetical protein
VLVACTPPCEQTCNKLRSCDLSPRANQFQCEEQCEGQAALYAGWDDEAKQQALEDLRSCVAGASCEELEQGVCYDETIWSF